MWLKAYPDVEGSITKALDEGAWIDGEIVAAGQLRQGKAPTLVAMLVGWALWEVLRPRRSKKLPRHFVLAVTRDGRVVAFKAVGGRGDDAGSVYTLRIRPGEQATYRLEDVAMDDLPEGAQSKGGYLTIEGERFPVARPNLNGDPNTDALIALLAGLPQDEDRTPVPVAVAA